ncbi:hypothetical protein [Thiomonas delicata]|uniref:Uncharacterized protein n=1 Tax=Thiomonas delicata TaxID=364030 RepID=A0A238D7G9_THIDL|nr:hypothetical protein [Thiomonas delicata]SBP89263.1 hypothetical protein THIARS_70883 [Thiomonas delicata]
MQFLKTMQSVGNTVVQFLAAVSYRLDQIEFRITRREQIGKLAQQAGVLELSDTRILAALRTLKTEYADPDPTDRHTASQRSRGEDVQ